MEVTKAIKWFEEELKDGKCSDDCVQCNANEKALEALKKQIPMKPERLNNKLLLNAGWVYACPVCSCECGVNRYYPEITENIMYCPLCGQKLDWE